MRRLPFKAGDWANIWIDQYPEFNFSVVIRDIRPQFIATSLPQGNDVDASNIVIIPGQQWEVTTFNTQLGVSLFDTQVLQVITKHTQGPLVTLATPNRIHRLQRRQAVRMPLQLPVTITSLVNPAHRLRVMTRDLSARGMSVVLSDTLATGSEWQIKLQLPDGRVIQNRARCVRSQPIKAENHNYWRTLNGFEFVDLSQDDEDALFRVILQKERDLLKNLPG